MRRLIERCFGRSIHPDDASSPSRSRSRSRSRLGRRSPTPSPEPSYVYRSKSSGDSPPWKKGKSSKSFASYAAQSWGKSSKRKDKFQARTRSSSANSPRKKSLDSGNPSNTHSNSLSDPKQRSDRGWKTVGSDNVKRGTQENVYDSNNNSSARVMSEHNRNSLSRSFGHSQHNRKSRPRSSSKSKTRKHSSSSHLQSQPAGALAARAGWTVHPPQSEALQQPTVPYTVQVEQKQGNAGAECNCEKKNCTSRPNPKQQAEQKVNDGGERNGMCTRCGHPDCGRQRSAHMVQQCGLKDSQVRKVKRKHDSGKKRKCRSRSRSNSHNASKLHCRSQACIKHSGTGTTRTRVVRRNGCMYTHTRTYHDGVCVEIVAPNDGR